MNQQDRLSGDVRFIKGVGEKRASAFYALGVHTAGDLLSYYPRAYEDSTQIKKIMECQHGETVCIRATVSSALRKNIIRRNMTIYTVKVSDGTGILELVWFNMRFLDSQIKPGEEFIFCGKIQLFPKKQMQTPLFERPGTQKQTGRIVPVYPLTAGLTQKIISACVESVLSGADGLDDPLPAPLREKYGLCPAPEAYRNIHFPASQGALDAARKRLVFEELFFMQAALFLLKGRRDELHAVPIPPCSALPEFIRSLPFPLTGAQNRVLSEIMADIQKEVPMNRLVQGDVGSGKTIIAACAMFAAAQAGMQSALMAPTEILAAQHCESLQALFAPHGVGVELLTGSMGAKARREALERIACGESAAVVGTHALLGEQLEFANLNLVITDEQHRFGVNQRKLLGDKGQNPHTLVMTATPIPRTLALVVYGDLEVSAIDELPPGRQKVDTFAVGESMRSRIYAFIRKEVSAGRQAYIVCPLVEESEQTDLKSVTEYAETLKKDIFPDLSVAFLHGKMKPKEKEAVMSQFASGSIQILVATSVIEVGVNVPNASVMVVENAERFGLSQLHQLRGRVGRGQDKAYCILFNQSRQADARQRMEVMRRSSDGFFIAEKDLELRGPGEFFGTRQHGLPPLKIANLYSDLDVLSETTAAVRGLLASDPTLSKAENKPILYKIRDIFKQNITFS